MYVFCVLPYFVMLYYCNMARWTWWDWSLVLIPSVFWCCWFGHL